MRSLLKVSNRFSDSTFFNEIPCNSLNKSHFNFTLFDIPKSKVDIRFVNKTLFFSEVTLESVI